MVTPIESNVSIFTADHMANQIKDPNATHVMGAQTIDVKKEAEHKSQTVAAAEETDTFVRVGEKEREREKQEQKKKKKERDASDSADDDQRSVSAAKPSGFNLMA